MSVKERRGRESGEVGKRDEESKGRGRRNKGVS